MAPRCLMPERNHEKYRPQVWGRLEYAALRQRPGCTVLQAIRRASALRKCLRAEFGLHTITTYRLDNPFMTKDARLVMIGLARSLLSMRRDARTVMPKAGMKKSSFGDAY